MGTFYTNETYRSTKSFFESELLTGYADGLEVKDHALRGNIGFVLIEYANKVLENGEKFKTILVYKIMKDEGVYGYKPFDESSKPNLYGCPEYILKQSNCNNEKAVEWRNNNREIFKAEKEKKLKVKGMIIGNTYKLGQKKVVFKYRYSISRFAGLAEGETEVKAYRYQDIDWRNCE